MNNPVDQPNPDDEVARAIIRRRDRFYVLADSPFEDCKVAFSDGVCTYYIARGGLGFHTGDHWQESHPYFRPAPHLMETIIDLVGDARERQSEQSQRAKTLEIIHG